MESPKIAPVATGTEDKTFTKVSSGDETTTKPEPKKQEPTIPVIPEAEKEAEDKLDEIRFIGEKTEKYLKNIGIKTYGQIAQLNEEQFIAICKHHSIYVPDSRVPDILKGAKQLYESGGGEVTSGGSKKGKPKLTGPFAQLTRPFELPDTSHTEPATLSALSLKQLLGLEIISPTGVSKNRVAFQSRRQDEGKTQQWFIGFLKTAKAKPVDVAKIVRAENELTFQWLPAAARLRQVEALRNCFARLYLPDGDSAVISLRRPITIPALQIDKKTIQAEMQIDFEHLPSAEKIRVEIEKLPKGDADIEMVMPHASIESNAIVYFRDIRDNKDPTDSLWFELHVDIRSKMKITAGHWIRVGSQPPALVREYEDLQTLHGQLRAVFTAAANRLDKNPRDKDLKSEKSKTERDLNKMDAYMKGIDQLLSIPVKLRVVADFDGYLVELAVSDSNYSSEDYKKDRKSGNLRKIFEQPSEKATEPSESPSSPDN